MIALVPKCNIQSSTRVSPYEKKNFIKNPKRYCLTKSHPNVTSLLHHPLEALSTWSTWLPKDINVLLAQGKRNRSDMDNTISLKSMMKLQAGLYSILTLVQHKFLIKYSWLWLLPWLACLFALHNCAILHPASLIIGTGKMRIEFHFSLQVPHYRLVSVCYEAEENFLKWEKPIFLYKLNSVVKW